MKKSVIDKKKNTGRVLNKRKAPVRKRTVFLSYNFSDVEDRKDAFKTIVSIALRAGTNAATEARAKGISRTYIRNYKQLVKVSAAGAEQVVQPKIKRAAYYIQYKPFTILHAVSNK